MSDYRPTYPPGVTPRHLRGEISIALDSVRRPAPPLAVPPDGVVIQRVPPGATRDNPKGPTPLAVQETRPLAVQETRPTRTSRAREELLAWLEEHGPASRVEIAAALPWMIVKATVSRLAADGLVKARRYSLHGVAGHKTQYGVASAVWPPLPAGARPLKGGTL